MPSAIDEVHSQYLIGGLAVVVKCWRFGLERIRGYAFELKLA
jgi:hypothetical protein